MSELPRVLIHNDVTAGLAMQLTAKYPDIEIRECNTYEGIPTAVSEFEPQVVYSVRFMGTPNFPCETLFENKSIKWVANAGAGTDHFGVWDPEKITVTNSAGVAADMMAEYVIGGFLHFTLDVPGFQNDQAIREWRSRTVRPLNRNTLLIIGLGNTGRALAKRARAFGMHVIGTRANPQAMINVDQVASANDLSKLLPEADFIAVSTPLTKDTHNLLDHSAFACMKNGVMIADVSRGHVIQQNALLEALESGKVAAAVLDVFEEEPLPDNCPFWDLDNVLISPHCSSVYEGWEQASFELFLENLGHWIENKPLKNIVDPMRGY